jgi:hypothetical protein
MASDFSALLENQYPAAGLRSQVDDWQCPNCARIAHAVDPSGEPTKMAPRRSLVQTEYWSLTENPKPYLLIQLDFFDPDTLHRRPAACITGFNADELHFRGT